MTGPRLASWFMVALACALNAVWLLTAGHLLYSALAGAIGAYEALLALIGMFYALIMLAYFSGVALAVSGGPRRKQF